MKKERTYKNYINYFVKWDGMSALGGGMLIAGLLFLWLGRTYFYYIASSIGIFGGIVVFFYGNIGRATDADLKGEIARRSDSMSFRELEEEPRFRHRLPKGDIEERVFEGYDLREELYLKKRKDGAVCSSEYTYTKMLTLLDSFYIKSLTFSFVEDKKQTEVREILFSELTDVTVERERRTVRSVNRKSFMVKTCFLCLHTANGCTRLHASDDIYTDELAETLKKKYITERNA